jgi:hypothetical protein
LFPKTKRPKIFSKTLVLQNGGLNLVFKTFFDLNFQKKFLIIPQLQQVGQLGPTFLLFFGGGGGVTALAMAKPRVWSCGWGAENRTEGRGKCAIVIA